MKRLLVFLLSFCLLTGCGTAPEAEPAPPPETVSPVYTDWSKLTPYASTEPLYAYFEPYSGDEPLQPRDDYGPLLPYIGACSSTGSYMGDLPLIGLVTTDGQLVTDPVYAAMETSAAYWPDPTQPCSFLILYRGQVHDRIQEEWGTWVDGGFDYTVTALDGSWVREFSDVYNCFLLDPARLVIVSQSGSLTVIDDSGQTTAFFPASALEPYLGKDFQWWDFDGGPDPWRRGGMICISRDDEKSPGGDGIVCWLHPETGTVTAERPEGFTEQEETYHHLPSASFKGYGEMDAIMDPVTGQLYYYGRRTDGSKIADLLDADGSVLLADCQWAYPVLGSGGSFPWVWGGRIACTEGETFCWYDLDGNRVFRYPVQTNSD